MDETGKSTALDVDRVIEHKKQAIQALERALGWGEQVGLEYKITNWREGIGLIITCKSIHLTEDGKLELVVE